MASKRKVKAQKTTSKAKATTAEESLESANEPEKPHFPVVGIGASAGGLSAFEEFFSGIPSDTEPNMAFVLVQHLDPDHKSILAELVKRYTKMEVFEIEDGMKVRPNCTYIIPPGRDMAFINGALQLFDPKAPRGKRMAVDFFFRSLAQDQKEQAIGIILSGTGSDGTQGVREIKAEGGMVIVQDPKSSEHDGMPRSALATGLVDYELVPSEMPARIMDYVALALGKPLLPSVPAVSDTDNSLKKILVLLRSQIGHDFSLYKTSTTLRRIERRMAVHNIHTLNPYVEYLQQNPTEVESLFRDLLIGVTSFFRNPLAFEKLEKDVLPELMGKKNIDSPIRIWVPGCSSGEEAYSIAILLTELQEKLKKNFKVQIFATDIDCQAIAAARGGVYPASIANDISLERLSRFFTTGPDNNTYRIHKSIRDMLVFSEQNVINDPPFSKLDLISCRNLLIYMSKELQKKIIPMFHYALNPDGYLFLGKSETIGDFTELFSAYDRKQKVYHRNEVEGIKNRTLLGKYFPTLTKADIATQAAEKKTADKAPTLRGLVESVILDQISLSAVLVNCHGDILYLHGRTGMYLEPTPGEAGKSNILKMAREGLRRELVIALRKTVLSQEIVISPNLRVKTNGNYTFVSLTIRPITKRLENQFDTPLYLVMLEEKISTKPSESADEAVPVQDKSKEAEGGGKADARIAALQKELQVKEEYLQNTSEELETSNEELKSSNEEMQSVNEELQSTNEELETSKEELQSINEELSTVNTELQSKVNDLTQLNNDMNNLLAGTGIATVFVDHSLCIMRFTPAATKIINLIQSDVGRPVSHIVSNLESYNTLAEDTREVLDTLVPKNAEVQSIHGAWYRLCIQPYRTINNVIEGAVITFVNIDETKKNQKKLRLMQFSIDNASDAIAWFDNIGKCQYVNNSLCNLLGYSQEEMLNKTFYDLAPSVSEASFQEYLQKIINENPYICEFEFRAKGDRLIPITISSNYFDFEGKTISCCYITENKDSN